MPEGKSRSIPNAWQSDEEIAAALMDARGVVNVAARTTSSGKPSGASRDCGPGTTP